MKDSKLFKKSVLVLLIAVFSTGLLFASNIMRGNGRELREKFLNMAMAQMGKPYKYGSRGPNSFDCSGFIYYSAKESLDLYLPTNSREQYTYCDKIKDSERQAGDLVFFKDKASGPVTHVGIYLDDLTFLSAASSGPRTGITISKFSEPYWSRTYFAAGRFLPSLSSSGNSAPSAPAAPSAAPEEDEEEEFSGSSSRIIEGKNSMPAFKMSLSGSVVGKSFSRYGVDLTDLYVEGSAGVNYCFFGVGRIGVDAGVLYDLKTKQYAIPVRLNFGITDYFNVYAGRNFAFGDGDKITAENILEYAGVRVAFKSLTNNRYPIQPYVDVRCSLAPVFADGTTNSDLLGDLLTSASVFMGLRFMMPIG